MYSLYGNKGCNRCTIVKNLMDNKGIEYDYKQLDDLEPEEKKRIMQSAMKAGKMSLPLIMKEEQFLVLEEVV